MTSVSILKNAVKLFFGIFGLKLQRIKNEKKKDPFCMQKSLIEGIDKPVVFDVGAYRGEITLKYQKIFPQATIYAFEPFTGSFDKLKNMVSKFENIKIYLLAFSDSQGSKKLTLNPDYSSNSFYEVSEDAKKYFKKQGSVGSVDVETAKIDDFSKKEGIDKINILKLDVEGAEKNVLMGAKEMLNNHAIDLIYSEAIFFPHYKNGVLFYELCGFLKKC
jgi:FkbM family methyltransferase